MTTDSGVTPPNSPGLKWRLPLLVSVVGFVIVAALAVYALSSSSGDGDGGRTGGLDVADPAKFDLPALEGTGRVRLGDFKGTPVVVNFFASWCEPCKKELPEFTAAARQLAGKVAFVGVNSKEITFPAGIALARSMGLAEAGIALARDVGPGNTALHDRYEVRNAMPITAFYDKDGNLKYVVPGQLTKEKLSERLREFYGVSL
jgi:cytochrome c biogenesis protein CcmG/thiol:disulfide interchange protein DsbE